MAGLAATGVYKANASSGSSLPRTTPAALIQGVQKSNSAGFTGTLVSSLDLGLPTLPSIGDVGDGASFTSLLAGSHTMQIWYGGIDKQRIALLGNTSESDLFRDGRDVWQWSSDSQTAVHFVMPTHGLARTDHGPLAGLSAAAGSAVTGTATAAPSGAVPGPAMTASSLTPAALADRALSALTPSTVVQVGSDETVADRSAYELILTPKADDTRVSSVHIAVDGDTKVPLGVTIYARGSDDPSLDVMFTSIRFGPQQNRSFVFTPPPAATVTDIRPRHRSRSSASAPEPYSGIAMEPAAQTPATSAGAHPHRLTLSGSNWSTIVTINAGQPAVAKLVSRGVFKALTPVGGSWGDGHLLSSPLLSVLVTDDGRILVGAVDPAQLYVAAGTK